MYRLLWALGIAAILVAGLAIADIASTPATTAGRCTLKRNIVLPDECLAGCPQVVPACTVATRPYAFVFTQAARCADAVICG